MLPRLIAVPNWVYAVPQKLGPRRNPSIARLLVALFTALITTACTSRPADPEAAYASAVGGTAPAKTAWVTYDDPGEHAFTIEVPQGWSVQGGMYRFGYFDVRGTVDMRSPDGKILMRFDDANIPPYVLPGRNRPPEGQMYSKPQQFQMMVENYRDAQSFAETYGKTRFRQACQNLTPETGTWKPTMPSIVLETHPQNATEGTVDYTCESGGGIRRASVFVRTSLFGTDPNTAFWVADPVLSALTTPELMPVAQGIMQHVLDTFQVNPEWKQYQARMTQEGAALIRRNFQTFLAQMQQQHQAFTNSLNQQVAGFEARQNAQQAQFESFDRTLVGIQNASDPLTGEHFQVWTGPNANYYRNGLGNTVNSNSLPNPDYHQVQVDPQ